MNSLFLARAKIVLVLSTALLLILLILGSAGDLYRVRSKIPRREIPNLEEQPSELPAIQGYLEIAQAREMFKQSVVYETKKGPTVNILDGIQFLGVTKRGTSVRAVLFNSKTGISSSYAPSEMMGDLKINEIRDDRVILSHGTETLELIR